MGVALQITVNTKAGSFGGVDLNQYQVSSDNQPQLVFDGHMIDEIQAVRDEMGESRWMNAAVALSLGVWVWGHTNLYQYAIVLSGDSRGENWLVFNVVLGREPDPQRAKMMMFWMRCIERVYHLRPNPPKDLA